MHIKIHLPTTIEWNPGISGDKLFSNYPRDWALPKWQFDQIKVNWKSNWYGEIQQYNTKFIKKP